MESRVDVVVAGLGGMGSAAAYLVLGIIIFRWCERIAKRRGTLGQY